MTSIPINLAVEDELSERTLSRILNFVNRYLVSTVYRQGGNGYLKRTIGGWNNAAKGIPFLVLTDLDTGDCASGLIKEWLPIAMHPNLLFRVAVREVESWLLADPVNLADFLGVSADLIPTQPDNLIDPKSTLTNIARRSRARRIREDIAPRHGSTAKQGPDYNNSMGLFIRQHWNVQNAVINSPSLARTVMRLQTFQPRWPDS